MRRVVSEQIRALNDLSEIVSRQSGLDVVVRPAVAAAPARQEPQRAQPAPQPAMPQPAAPPRPRAPEPPAMEITRRGEPRERGWIADLLRRVNDDEDAEPAPGRPAEGTRAEPARNPGHTIESLNSLSVDIARAIDDDAFMDLWNRYRRGETHVFTRRLYTLQGQQTFDEIRRKYQREPEFRAAVDRYIDHFRALYDDAVRQDPEGALAQGYLNSDTGKVYTMLAHASGKLG
jgi:hypothetical protein